jgi:hypothetical protein
MNMHGSQWVPARGPISHHMQCLLETQAHYMFFYSTVSTPIKRNSNVWTNSYTTDCMDYKRIRFWNAIMQAFSMHCRKNCRKLSAVCTRSVALHGVCILCVRACVIPLNHVNLSSIFSSLNRISKVWTAITVIWKFYPTEERKLYLQQ